MKTGTISERQAELIRTNTGWLRQALGLLQEIGDSLYSATPRHLAPHRAGGHLRHIVEFYECFLDGLGTSHVDYDARHRDLTVERSRAVAAARIRALIERLESEPELRGDGVLFVRAEDSADLAEPFLISSVGRELQMLSSHTIHHFALISMTLQAMGHAMDPGFGMAPSTLRHRQQLVSSEAV